MHYKMKLTLLVYLLVCFLPVLSWGDKVVKIGFVDLEKVTKEYKAAQRIDAILQERYKSEQKVIDEMETQIEDMKRTLAKRKGMISKKEEEKMAQEINARLVEFSKYTKDKSMELEKVKRKLLEPIFNKINEVVISIGEKEGYSVIIKKRRTLFANVTLDLTDRIIKKLNATTAE